MGRSRHKITVFDRPAWNDLRLFIRLSCLVLLVSGCSIFSAPLSCPAGQAGSACIPDNAVEDPDVARLHDSRTWIKPQEMLFDPITVGKEAEIPVQNAYAKLIGPSQQDSLRSIAAKIWLIDNADHSIDLAYYIFKSDLIGRAMVAALCNAVKRGVDVRLMVDSIGSININHGYLKSLVDCSDEAGFMKTLDGKPTPYRARAQVLIFNALSKVFVNLNRRSHDKIMVVDGHVPEKAYVMTGGRNISLDYYGIREDGSEDPNAFRDLEILLKSGPDHDREDFSVGSAAEIYATLLYHNPGNKFVTTWLSYRNEAEACQSALESLRGFDNFNRAYSQMESYLTKDFTVTDVRLSHEFANLRSTKVIIRRAEILNSNPNSIVGLLSRYGEGRSGPRTLRIVSPYIFLPEYHDASGEVTYDGKKDLDAWLAADPGNRLEIVTNSVLTSDNFLTQAIIDFDLAPRMLLSDDLRAIWEGDSWEGETNQEFIQSEAWKRQVDNPRVRIYQLGRLDSNYLGGDRFYGKLHAKFFLSDHAGFVGTTNLDYRSRLYNNEMGYFIEGEQTLSDLDEIFEDLKRESYLWGSPEWLKMRDELRRTGSVKGGRTHRQRKTYNSLRNSFLKWQL